MRPPPYIRLDSSHPTAGLDWTTRPTRASHLLVCEGGRVTLSGAESASWTDPLEALGWMARTFPEPGRWVGYLGYECGRWFEDLPGRAVDDLKVPEFAFAFLSERSQTADMPRGEPAEARAMAGSGPAVESNFTREAYLAAVRRGIDYIGAGDVFQVNLSQRLSVSTKLSPLAVYQRLLRDTPAWYGGLLDFGDFALVCNSPELFVRVESDAQQGSNLKNELTAPRRGHEPTRSTQVSSGRRITTRPIKGTRPRMPGMGEALRESLKDQAELNMIVDLERNDLGRICRIGSVRVIEPRTIESHPTVYHGAATIEGTLRDDVGFVDLLRAVFPGGSITGAPKIRAMEIIDELEPHTRGPYCGAIGYLDHTGLIEFNVAIRTMTMKNGTAYVPVGGGIVADSDPEAEYAETMTKARAMLNALGVASAADGRGQPR